MDKKEKIRHFLQEILTRKGDSESFADDDSLLLGGRIDSLNILEIVGFLEKEFGYDLSEQEFDPNNFDSVETIAQLIRS
ncbi:MAG: acyl carrier protein [Candidatus Riflebacteria bacterium]|nr:acyl carrier protein [Candidatus Riflebacteria bacterium]